MTDKYLKTLDKISSCKNNCIFCFISQLPKNLRKQLYLKDDDFRYSFLYGNFITLTNITNEDLEYIIKMHLSPLYISVHSTDPNIRVNMLKNKNAGKILKQLSFLTKNNIQIHCQIVVCKNENDNMELEKTLNDLYSLGKNILSVGIVPVGLSKHRKNLYKLKNLNSLDRKKILTLINKFRERSLKERNTSFVYGADELFLFCNKKIPSAEYYENFYQIENGIGLTRFFINNFFSCPLPKKCIFTHKIFFITGVLGEKALKPIFNEISKIQNINIEVIVIKNKFLGKNITVSALLTMQDILSKLKNIKLNKNDIIFIPTEILNGDNKFLDNNSLNDLKSNIPCDILYCKDAHEFRKKLKQLCWKGKIKNG